MDSATTVGAEKFRSTHQSVRSSGGMYGGDLASLGGGKVVHQRERSPLELVVATKEHLNGKHKK